MDRTEDDLREDVSVQERVESGLVNLDVPDCLEDSHAYENACRFC